MGLNDDGMERRTSVILLQHWNELRDDRPFPHEDELDTDHLHEVWEHCFLLQVRDVEHVEDYNFTYIGPKLVKAYADGVLDMDNGMMVSPQATMLADKFREVITSQDPLLEEGEYVNQAGELVRFRQAMLPLGTEEGKVLSILGGAWYKLFVG
jgi:hypothetical protein